MEIKQIIKTRKYKAGYEVRTEIREHFGEEYQVKYAYTPTGDWIGSQKEAYFFVVKRGIKPEKANSNHCICSIGFCEDEQKWYGWSHRALCGFEVGSTVKLGDCAFRPSNKEEYIESMRLWYSDEMYHNPKIEIDEDGINVSHDNSDLVHHLPFSDVIYGKGEWTAETLEDAKQMAIDFADGVS